VADDPAPEEAEHDTLAQRALDVFVYAPAGFLLTFFEDLPKMAEKGRDRIDGQLRNARVMGQFAVTYGRQDLSKRLSGLTGGARAKAPARRSPAAPAHGAHSGQATHAAPTGAASEAGHVPAGAGEHRGTAAPTNGSRRAQAVAPGGGAAAGAPYRAVEASPALNLAIPDYDTLSASQVVRRLDGLGHDDLDAVRQHEAQGRKRRTILHRVEQLLNPGDPGVSGNAGAAAPAGGPEEGAGATAPDPTA
jgi:hypothetical protein